MRERVRQPERGQLKTTALVWLNMIGKAREQVKLGQDKPEQTETI